MPTLAIYFTELICFTNPCLAVMNISYKRTNRMLRGLVTVKGLIWMEMMVQQEFWHDLDRYSCRLASLLFHGVHVSVAAVSADLDTMTIRRKSYDPAKNVWIPKGEIRPTTSHCHYQGPCFAISQSISCYFLHSLAKTCWKDWQRRHGQLPRRSRWFGKRGDARIMEDINKLNLWCRKTASYCVTVDPIHCLGTNAVRSTPTLETESSAFPKDVQDTGYIAEHD